MKSKIFTFLLLFASIQANSCPLEGYWRSDAGKTLKSIHASKDITEEQMKLFLSDFFGKLYIHIDCNKFTVVLEDWVETTEFEIISSSKDAVTMKYYSELEGNVEKEALIEEECYSLSINDGQFKEYFCPVSEAAYNKAIKFTQQAALDSQ